MTCKHHFSLIVLFLTVSVWPSWAIQDFRFFHVKSESGLMQGQITCIMQDSRGLVWMGTRNGCCRFNGYTAEVFTRQLNNPNSLPDNFTRCILQDKDGAIWIGTDKGVCLYREEQNDFEPFTGISGQVSSLAQTADGNVYCASGTLYRIDRRQKTCVPVVMAGTGDTIKGAQVLAVDAGNRLWVGGKRGLIGYDVGFRSRKTFNLGRDDGDNYVISLYAGPGHLLYAGKNKGGLHICNTVTGTDTHITTAHGLGSGVVRALSIDRDNRVWAGTERGLSVITPDLHVITLRQDFSDPYSLSDNSIYSILRDREDNMWVGTYFGGASIFLSSQQQTRYTSPGSRQGQLKGKAVRQMLQEGQDIWIATEDGGLNRLSLTTGSIERITVPGLTADNIHSLCLDTMRHVLWIGSFMGGLFSYDTATGRTRHFSHRNSGLPDDNVFTMYQDSLGDLWIGTTSGLCVMRHAREDIVPILSGALQGSPFVFCLTGDGHDGLWIGTRYNGLVYLDTRTLNTVRQPSGNADGQLHDDFISTLLHDSSGRLWVGTNNSGLFLLDRNTGRFRSLKADSLAEANCIYALVEDASRNVWVTADQSVYRITPDGSPAMLTLHPDIPICHFNYNAALHTADRQLLFGSVNGLIQLSSDKVFSQVSFPEVQLLDIVHEGNEHIHIDRQKQVVLTSGQGKNFEIAYAAINPARTSGMVYQVKLEGADHHWQYVGSQQKIRFSHLPSGRYTFKVRATSLPGTWSNANISTITIVIRPPFYATPWAFLLYAAAIALAVWWAVSYYRRRLRERQRNFEMQLEKEKLRKLNQMKQDFFTEISHEFKTPLSLIIAPVKQMLERSRTSKDNRQNLEMILKGTNTLSTLVQQIVEVNDLKEHTPDLKMTKANVLQFISDVAGRFCPLARQKGCIYNMEVEDWEEDVTFSPVVVERIVNNLLSNAFKFTPADGTVELDASISGHQQDQGRWLLITVSDTGCGIAEADQEHIFEKFYQATHGGQKAAGWGVGLSMVKKMVLAHHGTIQVQSAPGRGSVFTVRLNVTNGLFPIEETGNLSTWQEKVLLGGAISVDTAMAPQGEEETDEERPEIFIIEDNADMLAFLHTLFSAHYRVRGLPDAPQALALMQSGQLPDLVLSDVMMPGMSGTQLCKAVKSHLLTAHIPVVLLTAKTSEESIREGYELGADQYISKPFDPKALLLQIHNILKTKQNSRRRFKESSNMDISTMATNSYDRKLLNDIRKCVEANLDNSEFCVNDLALAVGVSRTKLHLKLKSLVNMSMGEYIKEMRMRKAKQMLADGESILDTACATGFSDAKYFGKCFKKYTGMLISEYKQSVQQGGQEEDSTE